MMSTNQFQPRIIPSNISKCFCLLKIYVKKKQKKTDGKNFNAKIIQLSKSMILTLGQQHHSADATPYARGIKTLMRYDKQILK